MKVCPLKEQTDFPKASISLVWALPPLTLTRCCSVHDTWQLASQGQGFRRQLVQIPWLRPTNMSLLAHRSMILKTRILSDSSKPFAQNEIDIYSVEVARLPDFLGKLRLLLSDDSWNQLQHFPLSNHYDCEAGGSFDPPHGNE